LVVLRCRVAGVRGWSCCGRTGIERRAFVSASESDVTHHRYAIRLRTADDRTAGAPAPREPLPARTP
jgi:hypothetical protein